jgi:hypothetical protein
VVRKEKETKVFDDDERSRWAKRRTETGKEEKGRSRRGTRKKGKAKGKERRHRSSGWLRQRTGVACADRSGTPGLECRPYQTAPGGSVA